MKRIIITEEKYYRILSEQISYTDAVDIFAKYGGRRIEGLSEIELRDLYRNLVKKYHPDITGGDEAAIKDINVAYEKLKQGGNTYTPSGQRYDDYGPSKRTKADDPENVWAWAGYSGGVPPSTDHYQTVGSQNWIKKKAWEISGKPNRSPQNEYTFWPFDGHHFRIPITTYGSPSTLFEISEMVKQWNMHGAAFKIKAVFTSQKSDYDNVIYLVNENGQPVKPPVKFNHDSFNRNPGNDHHFVAQLRQKFY